MKIEGLKIQYTLTDQDKIDYGRQLSAALKELDEIDQEQKEVVAQLKSRKETVKSNIEKLSEALRVGWIHKTFSGHKTKNYETGEWEFKNHEGVIIRREKFGPSDYQMTTDDVKQPEVEDEDGVDVDLDALEDRIERSEPDYREDSTDQEEQVLGEDIPVVYPGADYMGEPDFTPDPPARGAGGKFKKKTT